MYPPSFVTLGPRIEKPVSSINHDYVLVADKRWRQQITRPIWTWNTVGEDRHPWPFSPFSPQPLDPGSLRNPLYRYESNKVYSNLYALRRASKPHDG